MNIGRIFASAVVRKVAYILVALVFAWIGIGRAEAATYACQGEACTRAQAYSACMSGTAAYIQETGRVAGSQRCETASAASAPTGRYEGLFKYRNNFGDEFEGKAADFYWNQAAPPACPDGETESPEGSGNCVSPEKCLAHNAEDGFKNVGPVARPFASRCTGGCTYAAQPGAASTTVGGLTITTGVFEFTGAVCGANPPPPLAVIGDEQEERKKAPDKQKECVPTGAGQTSCMRADGKECATASTGKTFCWAKGETGTKTDGPDLQQRDAGDQAQPPRNPPPAPETLQKKGETSVTRTTVNGVTTITAITTYQTVNGTNAGDKNQAEGPNGSTGDDDENEEGTASGGGDCDTPPQATDPQLQMIAMQAWATRCAVESQNATKSTGDIGKCSETFTVTGDSPDAVKLRGIRAQICPNDPAAQDDGATDGSALDGPDSAEGMGVVQEGEEIGADGLDDSGFGFSRACPASPQINVFGHTIEIPTDKMCDWLELGGKFVLLLAALTSIKILSGGGTA